jgi:hypothetical protein
MMAVNFMKTIYQFLRQKAIPHISSNYAGFSGASFTRLSGGGGASLSGAATTLTSD